jgi:hypothetical protein
MTAHNWQPVSEHSALDILVDRCTTCGADRMRHRSPDGKRTLWTRYRAQCVDINNTLPWRAEKPPCKEDTES